MGLTKEQIKSFIRSMAQSQGFYGRLCRDLDEEAYDYLASQNFDTELDLIFFFRVLIV